MQPIRHTINIVEIGYHLCRIVNGAIIKTLAAQRFNIAFAHAGRRVCQLDSIGTQHLISLIQARLSPIGGNSMDEAIRFTFIFDSKVADLSPEVMGVGADSVVAVVFAGNNHGQHFALAAA